MSAEKSICGAMQAWHGMQPQVQRGENGRFGQVQPAIGGDFRVQRGGAALCTEDVTVAGPPTAIWPDQILQSHSYWLRRTA